MSDTNNNPPPYNTPAPLVPPTGDGSTNSEAKKVYTFNETGNIMVATTDIDNSTVQADVLAVFQEVSVFFAAMTKAMSDSGHSLYDMDAMKRIIDGSGMFVQVTQEDVSWSCTQVSATFSQELIEALLGLPTGAGEMGFAAAMIKSIGKGGLTISGGSSSSTSKVGNIVFVCEYILGMPIVSAIVVYAEYGQNEVWFKVGPCISGNEVHQDLQMTKETYLFVLPASIKKYAPDLVGVTKDQEYTALIDYLEGLLDPNGLPPVFGAVTVAGDSATPNAVTALTSANTYVLNGSNFGPPNGGVLNFANAADPAGSPFTIVNWSDTSIVFKTSAAAVTTATPLTLFKDADAVGKKVPSGTTTAKYTNAAASVAANPTPKPRS